MTCPELELLEEGAILYAFATETAGASALLLPAVGLRY